MIRLFATLPIIRKPNTAGGEATRSFETGQPTHVLFVCRRRRRPHSASVSNRNHIKPGAVVTLAADYLSFRSRCAPHAEMAFKNLVNI